jgi:hypothetical protein
VRVILINIKDQLTQIFEDIEEVKGTLAKKDEYISLLFAYCVGLENKRAERIYRRFEAYFLTYSEIDILFQENIRFKNKVQKVEV